MRNDLPSHPAVAEFLELWDAPVDVSNGSRQGMDDHEQGVVYAAQRFVAAEPPEEVRVALVEWLRVEASLGGPWNYGGQALRIICRTHLHPLVAELELLLGERAPREQVLAFIERCYGQPIEILDAVLSAGWGRSPAGIETNEWKALIARQSALTT